MNKGWKNLRPDANNKLPEFTLLKEKWEEYKKQEQVHLRYSAFASFIGVDRHTVSNWRNRKNLSLEHKKVFNDIYSDIEAQNIEIFKSPFGERMGMYMLNNQNGYMNEKDRVSLELKKDALEHQKKMDVAKLELEKEKVKNKIDDVNNTTVVVMSNEDVEKL